MYTAEMHRFLATESCLYYEKGECKSHDCSVAVSCQESFQIYSGTEKDITQTNVQLMYRLNINNRTPHTGSTVHIKH